MSDGTVNPITQAVPSAWLDLTQIGWDHAADLRSFALSALQHDDERGLLGAALYLALALIDVHRHEVLVASSSYLDLIRRRHEDDYCPVCHRDYCPTKPWDDAGCR